MSFSSCFGNYSRRLIRFLLFLLLSYVLFVPISVLILRTLPKKATGPNFSFDHLVTFKLLTRQNPESPRLLYMGNGTRLLHSHYNPTLPVKFFAHGWNGKLSTAYPTVRGWLEMEDCNVILVDWSILAAGNYDEVAAQNVPVAGRVTGAFIRLLINQGTPFQAFHLVGENMGAHVVGIAGANVQSGKIPRITGLDPASKGFPLKSLEDRLDATDAQFVDVIHTDLHPMEPIGHADFYPICWKGRQESHSCSDSIALDIFAASIISPVGFHSVKCASKHDFVGGLRSSANETAKLGYHISSTARGTFYNFVTVKNAPSFGQ